MSLIKHHEIDAGKTFDEVCVAAAERWEYVDALAREQTIALGIDPKDIIKRVIGSAIYGTEFSGAIEENDYFLQKYSDENPGLPERIRSLYGLTEESTT